MRAVKVLNNSLVLALDEQGREIILRSILIMRKTGGFSSWHRMCWMW
jgi:hypothetical protein